MISHKTKAQVAYGNSHHLKIESCLKKEEKKKEASTEGYLVPRTTLQTPWSGLVNRVISSGISSKLPLSTKENRSMMASAPSLQACETKRAKLMTSDLTTTFNFWQPRSKKGTNLRMTFNFWRSLDKKGTNLIKIFRFARSRVKKGTHLIMTLNFWRSLDNKGTTYLCSF